MLIKGYLKAILLNVWAEHQNPLAARNVFCFLSEKLDQARENVKHRYSC